MIEYRKMRESDVLSVAQLEKLCFSDPWSESSIRYELTNPLSLWYVAVCDGVLAGYAGSQAVMDEADVMNIAVCPEFRGRAIAQNLMTLLISNLAANGVHKLSLEVRASNTPAIALYRKLGFSQVGLRPNYYRNPKEDAYIFAKEWDV